MTHDELVLLARVAVLGAAAKAMLALGFRKRSRQLQVLGKLYGAQLVDPATVQCTGRGRVVLRSEVAKMGGRRLRAAQRQVPLPWG